MKEERSEWEKMQKNFVRNDFSSINLGMCAEI